MRIDRFLVSLLINAFTLLQRNSAFTQSRINTSPNNNLDAAQTQQSNVKPIQATRWIESVKQVQKTKRDVSEAHDNIEQSIKTFDDNSDGTLIVINYNNLDDTVQADKKSDIDKERNHEIYDGRGFSIVLDDNGSNNEEEPGKKDEVYSDIQSTYKDMEKEFTGYMRQANNHHKRVRVIVITPKDDETGTVKDKLPDTANMADKSTNNDNNKFQSQLDIDIDKLKNIKQNLNLLSDDADSSPHGRQFENEMTENQGSSDVSYDQDGTLVQGLSDNDALKEAQRQINTINSYVRLNPHAQQLEEKNAQKKNLDVQSNNKNVDVLSDPTHERMVSGKNKEVNFTVVTNTITDSGDIRSERGEKRQRNTTENGEVAGFSHEVVTIKETQEKEGRKNDIAKYIQDQESVHNKTEINTKPKYGKLKIISPPGNPRPSSDQLLEIRPIIVRKDLTKKKEVTNENESPVSAIRSYFSGHDNDVIKYEKNADHLASSHEIPLLADILPTSKSHDINIKEEQYNTHEIKVLGGGASTMKTDYDPPTSKSFSSHILNDGTDAASHIIDKRKAEAIIEFLNRDPLESWHYQYPTLKSLDLNSTILRSGLVNSGNIDRLKAVMRRALKGLDITLSVVGGSISAGGGLYKDKGNIDGLYYKGVVDWWNKMITPLTGSEMKINNIAIGSIGTDYFSYCIKNHISNETDIVLWELAANDFNRYKMQPTKGARPLERLTRMVLELHKKPALLHISFFKGVDYKTSRDSCPNFEDQGEDIIAHYYKIPSLSWRAMVCNGLVNHIVRYTMEVLFSQDQYHPSLCGHAQMSLLLLLHLRHVMWSVLQAAIKNDGVVEIPEESFIITEPLFMGPKYPEPLCWTLIKSNLKDEFVNTLAVRVIQDDGFKMEYATNFPIRFDKVVCWKAEKPYGTMVLNFYIPKNYGPSTIKRLHSELAVTTHSRWGGSATLWVNDMKDRAIVIKEGRPIDPGKRAGVDSITNDIKAGTHTLNIRAHDVGFCLAGIMIDGS